MKILVLNGGSSSQKSRLYEIDDTLPATPPEPVWSADADWTHEEGITELTIRAHGQKYSERLETQKRAEVITHMLQTLSQGSNAVIKSLDEIKAVGHRVVHGGPKYSQTVLITPEVEEEIDGLRSFAPLHNPDNLEGIKATEQFLPDIPQFAVFDTAYHRHLPPEARIYPGPYEWYEQGIHRYGFHGISHQYCARRSAQIVKQELADLRIINCHLGNGCSLAAISQGQSIDTTMGFTPLEGLMMGSRSGTIDPSILIYLQREHQYTPDDLEKILNKQSGLKGVSGVSADMRQVQKAAREGNERAKLALNIYIYRLRYFIGAFAAVLNGIDVLTFTGGVGENSAEVRAQVCAGLRFLGLELDQVKNTASPVDEVISEASSSIRVLIVHTEEDWEIAQECWQLL